MSEREGPAKPEHVLAADPAAADMIVVLSEWTDEDGKTIALTICDNGEMFEVATTYRGVGTRVVYQGEFVTVAARIYNDLIKSVVRAGFSGEAQPVAATELAEAILQRRAKDS